MATKARRTPFDLAALLSEGKRLLDDQRRALQAADFPTLLGTTSALQRLAEQLGADDGALASPAHATEHVTEIDTLRRCIAGHQQILEAALAATVVTPHSRIRASIPAPGRSLLLDHHT